MKKRIISSALSLAMTSSMLMCLPGVAFADTAGVKVDATNFPDSVFREAVAHYDFDENGYLDDEEIGYASYISLGEKGVTTIKGVELLSNLQYLYLSNNSITSVDLSKNTELSSLSLYNNKLTELDVSKNTKLTWLDIGYNDVTKLDVSGLKELTGLDIDYNEITVLDLSKNTKLESLWAISNEISTLKLPAGAPMTALCVPHNKLTGKLDVSGYTKLNELYVGNNQLTELVIGEKNGDSLIIMANENKISKIDVSKCPTLTTLWVDYNEITSLDVTKNPMLVDLECAGNSIKKIELSKNTKLTDLALYGCDLEEIDLTMLPDLKYLTIAENNLTKLDISKNTKLETLFAYGNNVDCLDITNCPGLIKLFENGEVGYTDIDTCVDAGASITADTNVVEDFAPYWDYVIVEDVPDGNSIYKCLRVSPDTSVAVKGVIKNNPVEPGVGGFITRLYDVTFGRKPDMEGKNYWKSALIYDGKNGADLARAFLCSPEFAALKTSDDKFLETLYSTFFNRASDSDGKTYWLGQIKSGMTRDDVITGFINSAEWADICMGYGIKSGSDVAATQEAYPNPRIYGFAKRLYTTCLGREAEEDGLKYWAFELANFRKGGSEVAKGFFFSEELVAKKLSNEEFVNRLYLTFMDREPDEGGLNYWLGEMKKGMTPEQVFDGFAGSEEWAKICANYGINK